MTRMDLPSKGSPTSASAAKKSYHHGNLREALVEAAIELIGEEGAQFQLRAVARKAGVSPAAPYRHFRDKADLLQCAAEEVARRLVETTEAELQKAGDDPMLQFQAQGVAFVKFAVAHPAHFRVINLPEVAARFDEHVHRLTGGKDLVQEVIRASRDAGRLGVQNPAAVQLAAKALVYGLARMLVDGHTGDTLPTVEEAERIAQTVTGILGVGLLPRPRPAGIK